MTMQRARLLFALLMIGLVVVHFEWGPILRCFATASEGDVGMWLYASDAAPGDRLEGRARVDAGKRVVISGVRVERAGEIQTTEGHAVGWGDTITSSDLDEDDDELDFSFTIPDNATPGSELALSITVRYTAAHMSGLGEFSNSSRSVTFAEVVTVHGRGASVLRRIAKGALAVGSWAAVLVLTLAILRSHARRRRDPSAAWVLAIIPYAIVGVVWFSALIDGATRLHGWWLTAASLALWFAAVAVAMYMTRYADLVAYTVEPMMIAAGSGGSPFRGGEAEVRVKSVAELDLAWFGAGLIVRRRNRELVIAMRGQGIAVVPVPASEIFGDTPFEVRATNRTVALTVLEVVSPLLGELRVHSEGDTFRVLEKPSPLA